jgi:hypothetical protein
MQRLTKENNLFSARLFGKILGHASDYYVVEAPNEDAPEDKNEEEEEQEEKEPPGQGVNKFAYYVTSTPFAEWIRLPDASPKDI